MTNLKAYDVTQRDSFEALTTWFNELDTFTSSPDVVKIIVGNKVDKEVSRVVTAEEGQAFADKMGCLFVECSAKRGSGVSGAFDELVNRVRIALSLLAYLKVEGCANDKKFNDNR